MKQFYAAGSERSILFFIIFYHTFKSHLLIIEELIEEFTKITVKLQVKVSKTQPLCLCVTLI